MSDIPPRSPRRPRAAGGMLIALGAMAGAFGGAFWHESSLGFFIGLGVGSALAMAVWLRDRGA